MTVAELRTWLDGHQQTNGAIPEDSMQVILKIDTNEDLHPRPLDYHARFEEYRISDLDIDARGNLVIKSTSDHRI